MLLGLVVAAGAIPAILPPTQAEPLWQPAPGTSWQWQLSRRPETPSTRTPTTSTASTPPRRPSTRIHANGGKGICYISVGSWEHWRPDKGRFPRRVLRRGYYGWPGEKWLDVRQLDALAPIMEARMDACKEKGFDAIEPDTT
jgi:hypothetical protein